MFVIVVVVVVVVGGDICPLDFQTEAQDLLKGMLCADPEKRLCSRAVAAHPWMAGPQKPPILEQLYVRCCQKQSPQVSPPVFSGFCLFWCLRTYPSRLILFPLVSQMKVTQRSARHVVQGVDEIVRSHLDMLGVHTRPVSHSVSMLGECGRGKYMWR